MSQSKNGLSPEGIALIIKACEQAGVRSLKYAGLHLEFGRPAETPQVAPLSEVPAAPAATPDRVAVAPLPHPTAAEIADIQKRESDRSLLRGELDLKDDQLAEMWLTDPHAAEQLEIHSQLEESNGGTPEET